MTRRLGVCLLGIAILAGCAGPHLAERDTNRIAYGAYLRGLMLERSLKLPDALDAYREALEYDRRSPLLHVRMGAAYVKMGKAEEAFRRFEQALAEDPNQPDALRWMAMLHMTQGRLDRAVADYERLLTIEPEDQFIASTLADLYVLQGDLPKAIALYQRLIHEFGSTNQLHFNLGVLYGRVGRFDEAIEELSRALERAPDSVETRVALGLTYELSGRPSAAAAHYEEAIREDAFNPRLYMHAARAHAGAQEYTQAAANYQAVLDLSPHNLEAITGFVRIRLAEKRYSDAAQFLARQLQEAADKPALYMTLGVVYRSAKQSLEALRAFEEAIRLKPDDAQAHFLLAAELDQLEHRRDARQELRKTLELDPKHADAMNYLGYLNAEEGQDLAEAKALIEHALTLDPDNGAYEDSLGWVYYQMGKMDEAIATLERATTLLDTDPVVFEHLGDAYFKRHDLEQARHNWERALKLEPHQPQIVEKLKKLLPETATVRTP